MTLVAARVFNGAKVAILGDSRITFSEERTRPSPNFVLKTVVLRPDLAVSYAGDIVRANIALQSLDVAAPSAKLTQELLQAHLELGLNDPDFLISELSPSPRFARIRSGVVEHDLQVAWLGNHSAFGALQEKVATSEYEDARVGWTAAFRAIVTEGDFPDIGDFVIECYGGKDGFVYKPETGCQFWPARTSTNSEFEPLHPGTAANGGYSWRLLVPREPGVGAVALYFDQGRLGVMLFPRKRETLFRFPDVDFEDFTTEVTARFGIRLWGLPGFSVGPSS